MTTPTKREIKRLLEALKREQPADAPSNLTVEWREAAPDERPTGIEYDPETETLYYDIWPAQRECLTALNSGNADIVGFLGGYGTGKSVLGARWLLAQALTTPGSRFLAMGKTFTEATGSTFTKLFAQLPGDNTATDPERSPLVADYIKADRELTLTNGTVIVLGSADKWDRYAGAEFGGIWLDEPSQYQADLHRLLEMEGSRLRGVAGSKVRCWTLTGNGFNDAYEILEKRQDATGKPLDLEIELVRASTLDNPYLEDDVLERFKRQYSDTQREEQALHGGFAAATGLVYATFSRETHVIPHAEAVTRIDDSWRIYGHDVGWNNPSVVLELGKTPLDQLVVLDVFYETESHTEDVRDWLEGRPTGTIYCDHDPAHIDRLERAGYRVEKATKDIDAGIAEVRKRLEPDGNLSVAPTPKKQTVRRPFMGHPAPPRARSKRFRRDDEPDDADESDDTDEPAVGLLVSERCRPLIREFFSYTEDDVGAPGARDHCLDALRYAVMGPSST
ncbi:MULTISPECIES: terminase large subunit domain-containing protein [Natrialbaceae]|uniref:terminase large subunit domain-containing protein n=1 Tax=Natrialbaceae TaxID=1644061 RepID=UPI00207CD109|nr:terminase family protein [Natronococcus sp. CG52]